MLHVEPEGCPRRPPLFHRVSVSFLLLLSCLLAACDDAQPVRIGVVGNFQDPSSAPMRHAAALAMAEINEQGGIDGRPLEILYRDDREHPDSAIRVATELYDAGVAAVVGHGFSGPTLAAAAVYNGGGDPVVQISPSASAPDISGAGPFTFRLCPTDLAHSAAVARWVRDHLGLSRGAILYSNSTYGRGFRRTFAREFLSGGGTLSAVFPYLADQLTVAPYLDQIAADGRVQFLVLAGYLSDAEVILRDARARGLRVPVLGGDGLEGIERLNPIADGVYLTTAYWPATANPRNQAFVAAYQRLFPDQPPPNVSAAGTYDAIHLLRHVIERVGQDRARIRDALAAVGTTTPPFEGVLGTIAFDAKGDVLNPSVHVTVVRGGVIELAGGGAP